MRRSNAPLPAPGDPVSGSIFILALWTLFFLGALALAVGAVVSANIEQAARLRTRMVARELARAGVELALREVFDDNQTNWNDKVWDQVNKDGGPPPPSNEALFKENDGLEGGLFSVTYAYIPEDSSHAVTNYGVLCESQKARINHQNSVAVTRALVDRAGLSERMAHDLVVAIFACKGKDVKGSNGELTDMGGSNYATGSGGNYRCHGGSFRVLYELLLMDEFREDPELFRSVEPYLTVYDEHSFSGTATGTATVPQGSRWSGDRKVLAESRIDFVVNASGKIQYWHEY